MVTITTQRSFYPSNRCKIALINIGTWRAHNMYVIVCTLSTYRKKWWNPHRVTQYYNNPIYVKVSLSLIGQNCYYRSSPPKLFLRKGVSKICSKFTRERTPMPKCDFIEIVLRHEFSPVNLLRIFRKRFFISSSVDGCFCD